MTTPESARTLLMEKREWKNGMVESWNTGMTRGVFPQPERCSWKKARPHPGPLPQEREPVWQRSNFQPRHLGCYNFRCFPHGRMQVDSRRLLERFVRDLFDVFSPVRRRGLRPLIVPY